MADTVRKVAVARTTYHHSKKTSGHVTLLAYKDSNEAYELLDDREPALEFLAGSKEYILKEWGNRNRQLIQDGFQRDNMWGDAEWQQFIS